MLLRLELVMLFAILLAGCRQSEKQPANPAPAAAPSNTSQPATKAVAWQSVEEFDYALPPSGIAAHFKLELPEGYDDAGDFTRIHIQVKGQPEFVLDNDDGWIALDTGEQESRVYDRLIGRNLARSKNVLILPSSTKKSAAPLVFLRSWAYASDPERLHVIGFQKTGAPILLVNTLLDLAEYSDLDGDGDYEIAGWPCLSQGFGADLLTYDPPHVYKVHLQPQPAAEISLPLSKSYAEKHYYGWAGPDCSEQLAVVLHPPAGGKPVIMKKDEAERLMRSGR